MPAAVVPHFRLEFRGSVFLCSFIYLFLSLFIRRVLVRCSLTFTLLVNAVFLCGNFIFLYCWTLNLTVFSPFLTFLSFFVYACCVLSWKIYLCCFTRMDNPRWPFQTSHIFLGTTNSELSLALSCRIWTCRSFYQSMCICLNLYTL